MTTSALTVALTKEAAAVASQSFRSREVTKVYLALLDGHFDRTKYKTISYQDLQLKKQLLMDQREAYRQQAVSVAPSTSENKPDSSNEVTNMLGASPAGRSLQQDELLHTNLKLLIASLHEIRDSRVNLPLDGAESTSDVTDAAAAAAMMISLQEFLNISYDDYANSWRLRKRLCKFLNSLGVSFETTTAAAGGGSGAGAELDEVDTAVAMPVEADVNANIEGFCQDEWDVFKNISKNVEYLDNECIFLCHDIPADQLAGLTSSASEVVVVLAPLVENKASFRMNVCLDDSSRLIPDKDFYQCETWLTVAAHSYFQVLPLQRHSDDTKIYVI